MATKAEWVAFVNIRLESEHKAEIKRMSEELAPDYVWRRLSDLMDEGYAFSLTPDVDNNAVIATLTGKYDGCPNAGYSMSQRHLSANIAALALVFAHDVIAEGGNWIDASNIGQLDW